MTEPASDDREAANAGTGATHKSYPELVTGRGGLRDYALRRLKASRLLQGSAVIAVLCYGALPILMMIPDPAEPQLPRLQFWAAAVVVLMSLASWSLLFWWYPVLERTQKILGDDTRGRTIARTLESLAIGSVVVVHGLMAFIIVRAGTAGVTS